MVSSGSRARRFLFVAAAFLFFELLINFAYAYSDSVGLWWIFTAVVLGIIAAVGYLLLGLFSGSSWSLILVAVPILFSCLPDTLLANGDLLYDGALVTSLPEMWLQATIFVFLPAWAIGTFLAYLGKRSRKSLVTG
jgi:hypothetical protein